MLRQRWGKKRLKERVRNLPAHPREDALSKTRRRKEKKNQLAPGAMSHKISQGNKKLPCKSR